MEATLETSILAFEAPNCEVIELNLKEFVFGLVGLYLAGSLVGVINVFVGVCVWKQEDEYGKNSGVLYACKYS